MSALGSAPKPRKYSDEEIRRHALDAAIAWIGDPPKASTELIRIVADFEHYIRTGKLWDIT